MQADIIVANVIIQSSGYSQSASLLAISHKNNIEKEKI